MWFFERVGRRRCPIINISGGTEIVGCFLFPLPIQPLKPCSLGGPAPGMANAPIPAIHPNAPPMTPPVPAPVATPSGAFVCFSCAKSRVVPLSGNSTEISLLEKFALLS